MSIIRKTFNNKTVSAFRAETVDISNETALHDGVEYTNIDLVKLGKVFGINSPNMVDLTAITLGSNVNKWSTYGAYKHEPTTINGMKSIKNTVKPPYDLSDWVGYNHHAETPTLTVNLPAKMNIDRGGATLGCTATLNARDFWWGYIYDLAEYLVLEVDGNKNIAKIEDGLVILTTHFDVKETTRQVNVSCYIGNAAGTPIFWPPFTKYNDVEHVGTYTIDTEYTVVLPYHISTVSLEGFSAYYNLRTSNYAISVVGGRATAQFRVDEFTEHATGREVIKYCEVTAYYSDGTSEKKGSYRLMSRQSYNIPIKDLRAVSGSSVSIRFRVS